MEKVPLNSNQEGLNTTTQKHLLLSPSSISDQELDDYYDSLFKSLDIQSPDNKETISHQMLHKLIRGKYGDYIVNKENSKDLQRMIEKAGNSIVLDIFVELKSMPDFSDFLIHVYSNYFMVKLYTQLECPIYEWQYEGSRLEFLDLVFVNFQKVACSCVGTFFIQNLIQSFESQIERDQLLNFFLATPASSLIGLLTVSLILRYYLRINTVILYLSQSCRNFRMTPNY